ncbi:MAG: IS3 family transposase [Chloroflexales bacterium]|nr:IS3 family transposase [Chloroflexales bacterium]
MAAHAPAYPVSVRWRVLGLALSGSDAGKQRPRRARARQDQPLTGQIPTVVPARRPTYGRPRVHAALPDRGGPCGRQRGARLRRPANLLARRRWRWGRTTASRHGLPVGPTQLAPRFPAAAPNRVWRSAITYLPTRAGWVYRAVVLDVLARRVVGWSMPPTRERGLVIAALQDAGRRRRPPAGLLHQSDRGRQDASADDQALLQTAGMTPRMSRAGNCWDNAVMESLFATRKAELPQTVFPRHAAARQAVFASIERFSNRQRRHSTLA